MMLKPKLTKIKKLLMTLKVMRIKLQILRDEWKWNHHDAEIRAK